MKRKSNELYPTFDKNKFNIISIGRLAPEKHFDLIPYISSKISSFDHSFKCYIVGSGSPAMFDLINEEI